MKPMGTIPLEVLSLPLTIGGLSVEQLLTSSPLFVYDTAVVQSRVARFRAAFPGIDLHYAVKANPFSPLLAAIDPAAVASLSDMWWRVGEVAAGDPAIVLR